MIVLGEINLRFRCEVRSLGYRLDGSKDELHPRFPSDKEAKPFETRALQDFFQLGSFLGKEKDIMGVGYNLNQSIIAIGSGGISGKGFLQGTQTKGRFVPRQHTDYIFSTIGEEWGFYGTSLIIILFTCLLNKRSSAIWTASNVLPLPAFPTTKL